MAREQLKEGMPKRNGVFLECLHLCWFKICPPHWCKNIRDLYDLTIRAADLC